MFAMLCCCYLIQIFNANAKICELSMRAEKNFVIVKFKLLQATKESFEHDVDSIFSNCNKT